VIDQRPAASGSLLYFSGRLARRHLAGAASSGSFAPLAGWVRSAQLSWCGHGSTRSDEPGAVRLRMGPRMDICQRSSAASGLRSAIAENRMPTSR
jgi:hypothetical protein